MGGYVDKELLEWFTTEYPKYRKTKLDMGKSYIPFKKPAQIPFQLIGALAGKMSVAERIRLYESQIRKCNSGIRFFEIRKEAKLFVLKKRA